MGKELKDMSISYTGEVIEKASFLTLDQVLPGLPSAKQGGCVDILEGLPPELAEQLKHPEKLVKVEPPHMMPRPRVLCEPSEWNKVVKAMFDRGIARPVESCLKIKEQFVLNGAFGVAKSGKELPDGRPALRLIMDLRATNWGMNQLMGDAGTLTGASTFQRIVVKEGESLLISGEDLTSAFYLFHLPEAW